MTDIPFRNDFRAALETGAKTATTRTGRYGEEGDTFNAFGMTFVLTDVRKVELGYVARYFHQREGTKSPEEFIRIWREIHPRAGFRPKTIVYLHLFRRVNGGG